MHDLFMEVVAGAGSNVNGSLGGLTKPQTFPLISQDIAAAIKGSRCCEMRTVSLSPVVSALKVSRAPMFFGWR